MEAKNKTNQIIPIVVVFVIALVVVGLAYMFLENSETKVEDYRQPLPFSSKFDEKDLKEKHDQFEEYIAIGPEEYREHFIVEQPSEDEKINRNIFTGKPRN
jgi:flagellar basal body-associated protein FliL